jgi:hypothetical protein
MTPSAKRASVSVSAATESAKKRTKDADSERIRWQYIKYDASQYTLTGYDYDNVIKAIGYAKKAAENNQDGVGRCVFRLPNRENRMLTFNSIKDAIAKEYKTEAILIGGPYSEETQIVYVLKQNKCENSKIVLPSCLASFGIVVRFEGRGK